MTMTLNTVTASAQAQTSKTAQAAQPAGNAAAAAPAAPAGQAAAPAVQPFTKWMGQQAAGAAQASSTVLQAIPDQTGDAQASAANASTPDAAADDGDDKQAAAVQPDGALLAAMAMPLMPLSPAQVAQALQAAQGNGQQSGAAKDDGSGTPAAAVTGAVTGQDDARRAALAQPAIPVLAPLPQQPAPVAQSAQPSQQTAQHDGDAAAMRVAVQPAGADAGNTGKDANTDGGNSAGGNGAANAAAQIGATLAAQPSGTQPAADTVKLAGPPTAWRQSLQEALGERLQLQVGNKVEQATIRLEPPQLGQIDIAIRHSAGSLEVNISASNSEVLRQLQTVSDNLKSDLSQRQFSEVAVTVAPAQKNNAAPFGDPQQQGRGRQQGRDQDESEPGRALAEAGNPASVFSLGGRDRA
jgi:flagellar hook-length control protein FliK